MTAKRKHNWSDAWLLLSIILASECGTATLDQIIRAGDGINFAIFDPEEIDSGLARLTASECVKEKNGVFSATNKVMKAWRQCLTPRRNLLNQLEDIRKFLGAPPALDEQPYPNDLHYPGFSQEFYETAFRKYTNKT